MTRAVRTAAIAVVITILSAMRGRAGALGAVPGCTESSGWAPNGRTMNSTSHQTMTKMMAVVNQVMDVQLGLLELDQGAGKILGMQEQHRLVMGAGLGLAVAQDARALGH